MEILMHFCVSKCDGIPTTEDIKGANDLRRGYVYFRCKRLVHNTLHVICTQLVGHIITWVALELEDCNIFSYRCIKYWIYSICNKPYRRNDASPPPPPPQSPLPTHQPPPRNHHYQQYQQQQHTLKHTHFSRTNWRLCAMKVLVLEFPVLLNVFRRISNCKWLCLKINIILFQNWLEFESNRSISMQENEFEHICIIATISFKSQRINLLQFCATDILSIVSFNGTRR